jgi:uncharacterized protein (DUF433 family)
LATFTNAFYGHRNGFENAGLRWNGSTVEIGELIVKTPGTCGGRARIAGRRVPVSSIYRWFHHGCEPEDILEKFENVTLAEIYAAIAYALSNREEIAAEIADEDRLAREAPTATAVR